jgi:hypothetical protein
MNNGIFVRELTGKMLIRWLAVTGIQFAIIATLGFVTVTETLAHGGEDHGDASAPAQTVAGRPSISGQSENFDLVVQYGAITPAKETRLDIYLSDYETSAPIAGATLQVSINGLENVSAPAAGEKDSGLYAVSLTFPQKGRFDLLFDISSQDKSDIVEVKGIEVGADEVAPPKARKGYAWVIVVTAIAALLLVLVIFLRRSHKSAKHTAPVIGAILLFFSLSSHTVYAQTSGTPGTCRRVLSFCSVSERFSLRRKW